MFIRYDPEDVSQVSVYHDGRYVGEVEARNLPRGPDGPSSCSLRRWEQTLAVATRNGLTDPSRQAIAELWAELDTVLEQRAGEQRRARIEREQARINQLNAPKPGPPVSVDVQMAEAVAEHDHSVAERHALLAASESLVAGALAEVERRRLEERQQRLGAVSI